MKYIALICLSLGLWTTAFGVSAQTMTCGRTFAQIGDSKSVIESKCGAPAAKDSYCKKESSTQMSPGVTININTCNNVEEWTYRPGVGQFVTFLIFEEGRLSEMRYGPRM